MAKSHKISRNIAQWDQLQTLYSASTAFQQKKEYKLGENSSKQIIYTNKKIKLGISWVWPLTLFFLLLALLCSNLAQSDSDHQSDRNIENSDYFSDPANS